MTDKLLAVDFFCGAGGVTEGLKTGGVRVIAGVDISDRVRRTYEANHAPESRFVNMDIRDCTGAEVLSWLPAGRVADDLVLVGCSPCQFWSRVPTDRERARPGSHLLLEFGRLVAETMPGYVVVENVSGIMRRGGASVLKPFLEGLKRAGFVVDFAEVRGTWYGVPQRRPRFVLVATRLHDRITLPERQSGPVPTVRAHIGDERTFPPLAAGESSCSDAWHRASSLSADNLRRIAATPHDGGDRTSWCNTDLQLDAYRGNDKIFRNVYSRMWWDRPAPTLTTRFNSLSNGRFGHPEQDRAISVREGAALQTFPPDYRFEGPLQEVCRQIGNAVPPALARALAQQLLSAHAQGKVAEDAA